MLGMNIGRSFLLNCEAEAERGDRVLNAFRSGSVEVIQREIGNDVVLEGRATVEAQWGVGYDFWCGDIFVRVHGAPKVSLRFPAVGCHVRVLGKLKNAYVENRVLVLSVKPKDYVVTGTT